MIFSIEKYNPIEEKWTRIADMNSRRIDAGVGVLNNVLYVVGGCDGSAALNSCEKYDADTNTWSTIGSK